MKIINKIIIVLLILIVITVCLIFMLNKNETDGVSGIDKDVPDVIIEDVFNAENKIQLIENKAEYFNIKNCIKTYSQYCNEILNGKDTGTKLLSIIPDFVKQELGLENINAYEKISLPNKTIRIDNIYKSLQTISKEEYEESTNICAYIVKGVFIESNTYKKEDFKLIVILDINNGKFLIVPQKYIEQKQINLDSNSNLGIYTEEKIKANQYNSFTYSTETAKDMAKEYFNIFKANLTYDLEYVYNYLDNEYKEKRFSNFDNFKNYIAKNKQQLEKIQFVQHLVNYNNNEKYIEYVCKDQNGNLYIFKETSPLNFKLKLDTYTITTEKFKSEYQKANIQEKVAMNIDKWVQMLNNRDYSAAYNVLDTTFRSNKFGSEEKFEAYMRDKYPLYYQIEFSSFSSETNIYIQDISLKELNNTEGAKEKLAIIMQLREGFDFRMSFDIK